MFLEVKFMNYKEYIESKEYVSSYEKYIQSIKDSRRVRKYNDFNNFLPHQQMLLLKDMEEYSNSKFLYDRDPQYYYIKEYLDILLVGIFNRRKLIRTYISKYGKN